MFMIVTYPWPVASAHVQLPRPRRQAPGHAAQDQHQPATKPDQQRRILLAPRA